MKILVIGAGATYAEALNLSVQEDLLPPLMNNFARQVWQDFNPHPHLDRFLESKGYTVENEDGRSKFYELEEKGEVNIEQFFAFCWQNRDKSWEWSNNLAVKSPGIVCDMQSNDPNAIPYSKKFGIPKDLIKGATVTSAGDTALSLGSIEMDYYSNMLRFGVGRPFADIMRRCFYENGKGMKNLLLTKKVITSLDPGDIVVSLNYDTVFECALKQAKIPFDYAPKSNFSFDSPTHIVVCKPHGSLNMVVKPHIEFAFGQPDWLGSPEPNNGFLSHLGLIPPRLNKTYEQNPIAKKIIDSVKDANPTEITFWGVGLTESDIDLVNLFKNWAYNNSLLRVVNPNVQVHDKFEKIFTRKVAYCRSVDEWI